MIFENNLNHNFTNIGHSEHGDNYFHCTVCKIIVYADSTTGKNLNISSLNNMIKLDQIILNISCEEMQIKKLLE